jgi:hypothetical protein
MANARNELAQSLTSGTKWAASSCLKGSIMGLELFLTADKKRCI